MAMAKRSDMFVQIRRNLLRWYGRSRRALPWRATRDPYAIWVSEIMLQQTRVETAWPYYERFLSQFPTVGALAAARPDAVLKAWEGLGYYSRARNLHRAAAEVVARWGGAVPKSLEGLRSLPGVGRYTAGAIASIAFGLDAPVVDGNVARVFARLFAMGGAMESAAMKKRLWTLAGELLPAERAGEFNQALMDLGATICLPAGPRCEECPVRGQCRARATDRVAQLPRKARTKAVPHYDVVAAVIVKRGRVLIDQRLPDALLGGLWEFPGGKIRSGEKPHAALAREVREELGIEIEVGQLLTTVKHAYSHFRITLGAYLCSHVSGRARAIECAACKWVSVTQLDQYAFPKANHAILKVIDVSSL